MTGASEISGTSIRVLGRQTAARQIALILDRGTHHTVTCTGPTAILTTTAALHSLPVVHYLDDGRNVTATTNPLPDDLRDDLRHGLARWSVSLVPAASMTTATLAARLGCTPAPDASPAVFYRRPANLPDRAPPPLLRDAWRRLAAYRNSNTRPAETAFTTRRTP